MSPLEPESLETKFLRIGVVGFSRQPFDENEATLELKLAIGKIVDDNRHLPWEGVEIVSGLTDMGVPRLAYKIAEKNGYSTVGIACSKAFRHECFPVSKSIIVGSEWGDESGTFLDYVNVIIRIGGGEQALREAETFAEWGYLVYECDLGVVPPRL